ncbi:MAG: hypothetical protein ABJB03_00555 [Rhodoglobus sp.]
MRSGTPGLRSALAGGSFTRRLLGDVMYGTERRVANIPITKWTLTGDIDAEVKYGGSATITYAGDFAESYTPHQLADALAAYGQELHLYMEISDNNFVERVTMGKFPIEAVPKASDAQLLFRDRVITIGSTVEVTLLDRFLRVRRARFRSLEQPASLVSAWAELARISRLQVTRNVADVAIPATVVYDRDRLKACQLLAQILGGVAITTADGTLTIHPDAAGAVVGSLELGEDGTILDVDYSMESDGVINVAVGDFEDANGMPIHVESQITSGPLSITGPYGEYVDEYSSDKSLITTLAAAQAAVDSMLALRSTPSSYELPVDCILNPLYELGDVVTVERMDRIITGRIRKTKMSESGPMSLQLGVISDIPK